MVAKELVVGLVLGLGVAAVSYGLGVKKESPKTSDAIFTIIGATAGLLGIGAALMRDGTNTETAGALTGGLGSMASALK